MWESVQGSKSNFSGSRHHKVSTIWQVDRIEMLNRHTTGTASAIRAIGDAEAAAKAGRAISQPGAHLVWTQFMQLADFFERR